ncbi:hypothetical protein [Hyphococcus sp.]|uniref:hypothetical protein n=1 Tax=Hyphococcus sp. TaxID=2038636 RepID=UPI003D0D7841
MHRILTLISVVFAAAVFSVSAYAGHPEHDADHKAEHSEDAADKNCAHDPASDDNDHKENADHSHDHGGDDDDHGHECETDAR